MDKTGKDKITEILKNKNNIILYLILLIGVAVMICSGANKAEPTKEVLKSEVNNSAEEERLCKILSDIKGAGEISVMITYYESPEKDLAYETKESESIRASSGGHEKTVDKQAVMNDGEPMVIKERYPDVKGVIVTAEGAADIKVKENIKEAVQAVLDVPAHRICVYEKRYK